MKLITRALTCLFVSVIAHHASAQWSIFNATNSPIAAGSNVPHVATDYGNRQTYVLTLDTSYHLYSYHEQNGWKSYPQYNDLLDNNIIHDTKARNGVLWCLSNNKLIGFSDNSVEVINYPAGYSSGTNGLVVLGDTSFWFPGGPQGRGITSYHPQKGWRNISEQTHPAFELDLGITDLKMDEKDSVLWIGTNCFNQKSGVFSYRIKTNELVKHPNDLKYGCIHAVEPGAGKTFVGTANFSSLRILDHDGTYSQSLDQPRIPWITEMRIDPTDSNHVWALTETWLVGFKDTSHYYVFDTLNSALRGYMLELSVQTTATDSMHVWVGTSLGLYRYSYRAGHATGITERHKTIPFRVYPNPATSQVTISHETQFIDTIYLIDMTGKTVMSKTFGQAAEAHLSTADLPPGIYMLLIHDKNNISAQKLVLTR